MFSMLWLVVGLVVATLLSTTILSSYDDGLYAKSGLKKLKRTLSHMFTNKQGAANLNRMNAMNDLTKAGCQARDYDDNMQPTKWICPKGADVNATIAKFYPNANLTFSG